LEKKTISRSDQLGFSAENLLVVGASLAFGPHLVKKGGQVINPEHRSADSRQVEEFFFFFSSLSRF
jgi:hypothetical protein